MMGGNGGAGRLGVVAVYKHPPNSPLPPRKNSVCVSKGQFILSDFFSGFLNNNAAPATPMKF